MLPWTEQVGSGGRSFVRERAVTDFPLPDSPTMASVSPWWRVKSMPLTAWVFWLRLEKEMTRSLTVKRGVGFSLFIKDGGLDGGYFWALGAFAD